MMKKIWGWVLVAIILASMTGILIADTYSDDSSGVLSLSIGDMDELSALSPDALIASLSADILSRRDLHLQNSGTFLTPGHSGEDYTFTGDYSGGQVTITGPGSYCLTGNLNTTSADYAIQVESPGVILDGEGYGLTGPGSGLGVSLLSTANSGIVTNFGSISGFNSGIESRGDYAVISDNLVNNNTYSGIKSFGNNSEIYGNIAFNHSDIGLFSFGHNSIVANNMAYFNRNGILSQGNYANVYNNLIYYNFNSGIYAGGINVGPEPGDEGHGYYARIINNYAIENFDRGIYSWLPHAIIQDNLVIQNENVGIGLSTISNNTTVSRNVAVFNPIALKMTDQALDVVIRQNFFQINSNSDIYIDSNKGQGSGSIYDNYLGSQVHVNGTGKIGNFLWANSLGPTPGSNVMNGPYIAGNYWSNPEQTGWSDVQEPLKDGYSAVPFEVAAGFGVYDTAPLVRVGEIVSSSSDEWTIIHPLGNVTYPRYSDPLYITQAKPGAILENLSVDGTLTPPDSSYTFPYILEDHTLETIGSPDPDQVHVRFDISPVSGSNPLVVNFIDQSIGNPISWYWQFGDGKNSTEKDPTHTYTIPGTYTVSLRAYNEVTGGYSVCNGCVEVS